MVLTKCAQWLEISASEEGRGTWHYMGKRKDLTHRELNANSSGKRMAEQRELLGHPRDQRYSEKYSQAQPLKLWPKVTRVCSEVVVQLGIISLVLVLQAYRRQQLEDPRAYTKIPKATKGRQHVVTSNSLHGAVRAKPEPPILEVQRHQA